MQHKNGQNFWKDYSQKKKKRNEKVQYKEVRFSVPQMWKIWIKRIEGRISHQIDNNLCWMVLEKEAFSHILATGLSLSGNTTPILFFA